MNFLWNPISVLENIGSADKPNYEKTIRIGQASVHFNIFLSNDWGPKKGTNLLKNLENGKNMVFICNKILFAGNNNIQRRRTVGQIPKNVKKPQT